MTIEQKFPKHKCGLYLTHNEYKDYYQTIEQAIEEQDARNTEWVTPTERQKAIETGSIWVLQWYPDTPIGFFTAAASDLDVLLFEVNLQMAKAEKGD